AIFRDAEKSFKSEKYLDAVRIYERVPDTGTNDKKLIGKVQGRIKKALEIVRTRLLPVLEQAREAEANGELDSAYKLYEQATTIDPRDKAGFEGIARIRGILHEKAKIVYTEGVIADSYSDFQTAKLKFEACLTIAP